MSVGRLGRLLAAAILAIGAVGFAPAGPLPIAEVRAAAPSLTFVTASSYEVRPDEGRVAVTVQITAANHLKDTVTRRYYYEQGYLAVLPAASNFAITAGDGSKATVAVTKRDASGVLLRIKFGTRLGAGKSMALTLTFDLADPGGAPDRALRISPSLVNFQAWAYGTAETPGSSVEVRIPDGYSVTLGRGPLVGPTSVVPGFQTFTSGALDAPLDFVADVSADRPGDLLEDARTTTIGGRAVILRLRAWPDDTAWRTRVADLLVRGLPVLGDEIGAPWPFEEPLAIQETLVRGSGGYAGVFDPASGLVQISYTAAPGVVLHEAAHAWFNGRLVADRWIAEAFASLYAERAAAALEVPITSPELADAPEGVVFPLNAWPATGTATADQDAYGYAQSLAVGREIARLVGDDVLRSVWDAAAAGQPAWSGIAVDGTPSERTGAAPPDWRSLLDMLEERVDAGTARELEALWRTRVLRPDDAALLAARDDTLAAWADVRAAAAPWALPRNVRDGLRAWQFDGVKALLEDARRVLRQRDAIATAAAHAGVTPPAALREAFEGPGGIAEAGAEAAAELAAINYLDEAQAARPADPGLVERVGLLGVTPEATLGEAKSAFEADDLDRSIQLAASARDTWASVGSVGRGRLVSVLLLAVAAGLLVWLIRGRLRGGRAARFHARRVAAGPTGPYGTLPDLPDSPPEAAAPAMDGGPTDGASSRDPS